MQPINGKPSGIVGVDGRPIGETPEQRIVREFHHFCNVTNNAFKRAGLQRVALGFTVPNREQSEMAMFAVQRWPLVIQALRDIENEAAKAVEIEQDGQTSAAIEADALGLAANTLRNALFGKFEKTDGEGK